MKRLATIFFALLFYTSFLNAQQPYIREIQDRDTLMVTIEKIASRSGLESRYEFRLTKLNDKYFINKSGQDEWTILDDYRWTELIIFEQESIQNGCNSTTYATVETTKGTDNQRTYSCWDKVDRLVDKLKLKE
jgi:hypothetical protein